MRVAVLYNDPSQEALVSAQDVLTQVGTVTAALSRLQHESIPLPCTLDLAAARAALEALKPDVVFNLVESLGGTDQLMYLSTSLLDAMGIAYTGAGTRSVFLSCSKTRTKQLLLDAGLPTAAWLEDGSCNGLFPRFPASFIIKSVYEHASFAIDENSIVFAAGPEELRSSMVRWETRNSRPCFAEQFVDGREFNLSLLGGPHGAEVLPHAEIDFSELPPEIPRIVGYEAKWKPDSFVYRHTPRIFDFSGADAGLLERLSALALRCWDLIELRGYARVDFRVDQTGRPWILEINANPCLSPDAGFAAAVQRRQLTYDQAIGRILAQAGCGDLRRESGSKIDDAIAESKSETTVKSIALRSQPAEADPGAVRQIVESTGVFSRHEVKTAVELVEERLAEGPASGYEFLFAEREGKILGYACYGPVPLTRDSYDLYWIAVRKEHQGKGIARLLLRETEARVCKLGGRRLFIETSSRVPYSQARGFYEKNGYERVVEVEDFYAPGDAKILFARWLARRGRLGNRTEPRP